MEQRTLELQLVSAKDLKRVNLFSKMNVRALASIIGDTRNGQQTTVTNVVSYGGTNLLFNLSPMPFTLDDSLLTQPNHLFLQITLFCKGTLFNKTIGAVHVPLKELFDLADPKNVKVISRQLLRPSGRPQGEVSFSYKFGDMFTVAPVKPLKASSVGAPLYSCRAPRRNTPPWLEFAGHLSIGLCSDIMRQQQRRSRGIYGNILLIPTQFAGGL